MAGRWWQARGKLGEEVQTYKPASAAARTACLTVARAAWQCLQNLLVRLTTNRAYKVSQIFGKLSDHCVPDGAFKCLLKKVSSIITGSPVLWSWARTHEWNKADSSELQQLCRGSGKRTKPSPETQPTPKQNNNEKSRASENRIYFCVLKSHITEARFPAYLNVSLVTRSLQKPSKGKCGFFSDEMVHGVVVLFLKHVWTQEGWIPKCFSFLSIYICWDTERIIIRRCKW